MRKLITILTIIIILLLIACSSQGLGVLASSDSNFYAVGLTYRAEQSLKVICGRISTVTAESDKKGMAGIEQDIVIETDNGNLTLEIINWYYGKNDFRVGYILYGPSGFIKSDRRDARLRAIYGYNILISNGTIHIGISEGENLILSDIYSGTAKRIIETSSYIEYWRYDEPGSFFYYGYVTIDALYLLQYRNDFYDKTKGYPFNMYLIHHNWGGKIYDKGEIDDRLL